MPSYVTSVFLALLLLVDPAFSFGAFGHRVIADLAQDMLTPKARAQAAALLGPPSGGGAGGAAFRLSSISVWADDIKSLRPDTRTWHYVTLQLDEARYDKVKAPAGRPPDSPNVITALNRSLAVLKDASADRYAREEALKWAVHLVGDLHQPLHVGEDHDRGGNLAKVKVGRRTENLHAVWDYVLLERLKLSADSLRLLLARGIAGDASFIPRNAKGTVEDWVDETHAKTRGCYMFRGKPLRKGMAVSLDRTYTRPNTLVVLEQLKIAAVRLALVLNRALDPAAPPLPPAPLRLPSGWREDTAAYFKDAPEETADAIRPGESGKGGPPSADRGHAKVKSKAPKAPGSGASVPETEAATVGKYAWSANSEVYHFADCADVARIKPKNLARGDIPPPEKTLHSGCPRKP